MNEEQLRALAALLKTLTEFNDGDGDSLSLTITSLTLETDGGVAQIIRSDEDGLYLSL